MSSAALQAAPHQPTALATPPLQYTSSHSSPTREAYHASQLHANSSSSSPRRPSRQRSGNGNGSGNGTAYTQPGSPMTSRAAALASPVALSTASPDHSSSPGGRRNMPPVAPPRTSSTQQSGSRRGQQVNDKASSSPRRGHGDPARGEMNGSIDASAPEEGRSARSRIAQEPPARTSSTREGRTGGVGTVGIPARSHPASQTTTSSKQPSREASEVLNRIIVSQPEVDIEREKERLAEAQPQVVPGSRGRDEPSPAPAPAASTSETQAEEGRRGGRSGRHEHSSGKRDKSVKFGDYILGTTIGEGEFGKVKLGWKQDGAAQVAIKLIKRDSVGNNPTRLAKIYREISILRGISHPNIVRLHEMVETERHIGIIMEYASGGELFDHILHHRYLRDNSARRLFAQLISGVGYLHKKGIVHRDLKLENLLLDRNKNIIITDFGFANTFDTNEELSEDEENGLADREFVKRLGLDKVKSNGTRKGDLMQTSCGSPCYAAPELVVSDSLYTGRKVDVWSCGVILYAMLAGYLPFDDDPANPEGDNINLLYKYIVSTPLTFPEYVTPHARDLLRRILVPNPRKRADLFEVARHSWLSEYAHVVELITSSTTTTTEIQNTTVPAEEYADAIGVPNRSASVREASRTKAAVAAALGGLTSKHGTVDHDSAAAQRAAREAKRRTVQVEYVAPTTQTQRGELAIVPAGGKARIRSTSQGPVEVTEMATTSKDKPLPKDPPVSKEQFKSSRARPSSTQRQNVAPARPARDAQAASDNTYMTGGSGSKGQTGGQRGQPIPPTVAGTNVPGRIQQPGGGDDSLPMSPGVPAKFARVSGYQAEGPLQPAPENRGHKRSSTISDIGSKIMGRSGSLFRRRAPEPQAEKPNKRYPPVSMSVSKSNEAGPRPSMDSRDSGRRSISLGFGKKRSGSITGSSNSQEKHTRRFSLIPNPFSLKAIGLGKDYGSPPAQDSQQDLPIQVPPQPDEQGHFLNNMEISRGTPLNEAMFDGRLRSPPEQPPKPAYQQAPQHQRYSSGQYEKRSNALPSYMQQQQHQQSGQLGPAGVGSDPAVDQLQHHRRQVSAPYRTQYPDTEGQDGRRLGTRGNRVVLSKNKKNFGEAYDGEDYRPHDHAGSSGPARRVMDFFRRRGKARGGEDR